MSGGGGEILRAVMEKNAVYSNPALYCIPLNDGLRAQRGVLQLDTGFWFLATSLYCTATGAPGPGFERNAQPEFLRIFDPATSEDFALSPFQMQISLFGDSSINNPVVLPNYLLFAPSQLIGVEWLGVNFPEDTEFKFVTFQGIEFGLREGL